MLRLARLAWAWCCRRDCTATHPEHDIGPLVSDNAIGVWPLVTIYQCGRLDWHFGPHRDALGREWR